MKSTPSHDHKSRIIQQISSPIVPQKVEFLNVEVNLKYQMQIFIRNDGNENEKIRIINPVTQHFTIKNQTNPFIIAPGLSYKVIVYFHLQATNDTFSDIYEDKIYIIGQKFKKQVLLRANKPNFKLQIPKFFKLGLVRLGKQTKFSIPIKNIGKEDVQIAMIQSSTPTIAVEQNKLIIKKQSQALLKIKVNHTVPGIIQEMIHLPNGESISIRGICSDQSIEIYNKQGEILNSLNLGPIFIGQKINYSFFIANNSNHKIEGLSKVFSNSYAEYSNLKIDLVKMTFINRNNPKNVVQQEKSINFRCGVNKFSINAFEDFQNKLIMVKQPSQEELKIFIEDSLSRIETNNRESSTTWKSLTELTEILYIKIVNKEQPIKIPINFCPSVPKIKLSHDKFQFPPAQPKTTQKLKFTVTNCNERKISLKLQGASQFSFEGDTQLQAYEQKQFYISFRPLILGQYSEHLKLSVFESWPITIKVFGQCCPNKNLINKENFNKIMNKSASLQCIKSNRYLQSERKRKKQAENISYLKNKITERTHLGFTKNPDEPIDLVFDACENPKVRPNKKFGLKTINSTLFFNNEQYLKHLTQKRKDMNPSTTRLNLKQIIKFSSELTPTELSKLEVKCDKLDFGNVFVGSSNQKQLIIANKNDKVILVEIDLCNNDSLSETKAQIKKIEPFGQAKFIIKLKPTHLGYLRIPIYYIINKQHMFEMDIVANVTLINLGFSTKQLKFSFAPNDINFQKNQTLIVTNHGSTCTKFVIIQPTNKAFVVFGNKEQEIQPNSEVHITVQYCPQEGNETGQKRLDSDKMVVKVVGGAENIIKCDGVVCEPKYSIRENEININELFISTPAQHKITLRNHTKNQTPIKIQLNPPNLSEVISLDQKTFMLHSEQRKQVIFNLMSHEVKTVKGAICISTRGGRAHRIPIHINFIFPTVQVVGCDQVNLGIVHIMTDHFEREIVLANRTKSLIKLDSGKGNDKQEDYIIEFIATQERVQLALNNTEEDSEIQEHNDKKHAFKKESIYVQENILTANKLKNPKKLSKMITLLPGVETKFKMRFIPKKVKQYSLKIPLYLHKAARQIEAIPQKIRCRAVQPLFFVNPYLLTFENVIISQHGHAHKKQFEIINPHNREVDWQILQSNEPNRNMISFDITKGMLKPRQSKKITVFFKPSAQGVYSHKIKLVSNQAKQIQVQLHINGSAVSPKITFNKNLLILPVVPLRTQSKGILEIQNYGYETVAINKVKFLHSFEGVQFKYEFLDGKLLSMAKKKLKLEISFKAQIPVSLTTVLEVLDQFGDKISIPVSVSADNCLLTTYPYLQMNCSTVVYDTTDNMYKLLVSKAFNSKNKQTNITGSSAVTGNFIKKWCNYELNINLQSFPDSLVQSRGELLYEMIIKMANGKPIIKRPSFTNEQKIAKMLQLHAYYSEVINALQGQGAFLNHIRPQYLLNMNDYLLYMVHHGFIIDEDQFQCLSHQSWTVLFYQLCKLYVQPIITDKLLQKFSNKHKSQKFPPSTIYSQKQIFILNFMNQYLGQQKIASLSDQARIFEVIQKIVEKTFKVSLNQELSKLKINADSLMLYEFLITVSKFLYTYLQQYGLSMYLDPNDLFTMGHKQFILFFISLMQNLVHFQSYSLIEFESASGEKNQKFVQLENPSKKKILKYWVKIYGSNNFRVSEKELEIEPQEKKILKVSYNCRKNQNQEAQLLLVPVKDEMYFTNAHCLNFLLKNSLIVKTVMKKINMKVHLYDIKTINLDIQLPSKEQNEQYQVQLSTNQIIDESQYPNYYLIQPGKRMIKNGKDKCEIKFAPLKLGEMTFKIIYISSTLQQFIYEFVVSSTIPNSSQTFKVDPMITDKEQTLNIKIPIQNQLKEQCLKFHREINKEKEKKKIVQTKYTSTINNKPKQIPKIVYQVQFIEESVFELKENFVKIGPKDKNEANPNTIQFKANFNKPYREYKSNLVVKNEDLADYRVYTIVTSVSIKPRVFQIKMQAKAREVAKTVISNKMNPFTYRFQRHVSNFEIQQLENGDLLAIYSPTWMSKDQFEFYIQNPQTFEQHIYKVKLQSSLPDPVKCMTINASSLFTVPFSFDIGNLNLTPKQLNSCKLRSDIIRKHEINVRVEGESKCIQCIFYPGAEQEWASLKLYLLKSDQYYQFILNIKNIPITDLGILTIEQCIGQIKKVVIKEIDPSTKDFNFQFNTFQYFTYQITEGIPRSNFAIVFKPIKQINETQLFRFKSGTKQYVLKICFIAKKLDTVIVPPILTENMDRKTIVIPLTNLAQSWGIYDIAIEDESRFKIETTSLEIKSKEKVNVKVCFCPKFIGDTGKSQIIFKSNTLPELTYIVQGISKFKYQQICEQVEGFEGSQVLKQICFKNQFNQREKFKFQISPPNITYLFEGGYKQMVRDLQPGEEAKLIVKYKCPTYEDKKQNLTKVTITKVSQKKALKEITLNLLIVKSLQDRKYMWECRARETLFETIKLPPSYALKQIRTDPQIQKYISFSVDQKNQNEAKVKFSPLKRIKQKVFNILLISDQIKFRILCTIKVAPAPIDDTILIRTSQIKEIGVTVFKLTNTVKQSASFRTYFQKNSQQLSVEPLHGILEPYGKEGTPITIKFKSQVHNKRVQDKLIVETDNMGWSFKVVGIQQKLLNF